MPLHNSPSLFSGPISLPIHSYLMNGAPDPSANSGPFTYATNSQRKAIITIDQTGPDVIAFDPSATAPKNLLALVSEDDGGTWGEYAGPSLFTIPIPDYITPGFTIATFTNCAQVGDDIFIVSTVSAGNVALIKFNLASLSWTVVNSAIDTYDYPDPFAGGIAMHGPRIVGMNSSGYGVAFFGGKAPYGPTYVAFDSSGTNLGSYDAVEPDAGWSFDNDAEGVSPVNGDIVLTYYETSMSGVRQRIFTWSTGDVAPTLSVATTLQVPAAPVSCASFDSVFLTNSNTGPNITLSYYDIANQFFARNTAVTTNTDTFAYHSWPSIPGRIRGFLYQVFPAELATGGSPAYHTRLAIVERDLTLSWSTQADLYTLDLDDPDNAPYDSQISAMSGNLTDFGIRKWDLVTANRFAPPEAHTSGILESSYLWYWQVRFTGTCSTSGAKAFLPRFQRGPMPQ